MLDITHLTVRQHERPGSEGRSSSNGQSNDRASGMHPHVDNDLDRSCLATFCLLRQLLVVQFVMILVPRKYSQHVRKTAHGVRRAMSCQAPCTELRDMQFTVCTNNGLVVATCVDEQVLCVSW